ncbi:MAG: 1-deoxy-D-xylulose-5-phosphate reductoisomerase [Rhodospirillaceae bacterium]|nr:1-deoxy-D-xylulose-5-phosphate reductoisomerase [Rhodospirillaceae bacterium]|tara:strand:+ start:7326 stop:8516 length:1191 start_codon:yes stop_codon:yes gene_type:complete
MELIQEIENKKSISILGSTGSIGKSTLDLISLNRSQYQIEVLSCFDNYKLLAEQAIKFKPKRVVLSDPKNYNELKKLLFGTNIEILSGRKSLIESASIPVDWVMSSIVGMAGLEPTISAVKQGTTVALANKECLVSAGNIFMSEVEKNSAILLPVDSEHNGIFQILNLNSGREVEKIILTASGGPFLNLNKDKFHDITPKEALAHPNWSMGPKISIDSATMMNKGLELIEAHYFFIEKNSNVKLDLIVHPQSIIHALVEFIDGSIILQMSTPDMKIPISYTLNWPCRASNSAKKIDLAMMDKLTFQDPDIEKFPAIKICKEVLYSDQGYGVALNAANEESVMAFLNGMIKFTDIISIIQNVLEKYKPEKSTCISEIIELDNISREITKKEISKCLM